MELIIIFILILLNGLFAMSEIAIVSARKSKLETDSKKGDKKSALALEIANSPNRFLSTIQIGITIIGILNGVFGGTNITEDISLFLNNYPPLKPYSQSIALFFVVLFITYFSLVLGELIPKRIGLAYAEGIARATAKPMNMLSKVTAPFIWLLSSSSNFILKALRIKTDQETPVTEEEIRAMVEEGTSSGSIEEIEHDIVERVFNLGDRMIGSLMTNRQDIVWLDVKDSFHEIKHKIIHKKHSVFLVCEEELDHVLGVVYVKDLFPLFVEGQPVNLKDFLRSVLYIPENAKAYDVLEEFKESSVHFGVVVDEYGSVMGVVTINDIINVLVGGIYPDNAFEYEVVKREDGSFLIDAQLPFDDFMDLFDIETFSREGFGTFHTLGGFVLNILKDIPETGDNFIWNNLKFEVVDMDGNRIDKILISKS